MVCWSGQLWTAKLYLQCWTRTLTSLKGCPQAKASPQAKTMLTQVSDVCLEEWQNWKPRNLKQRTECRAQSWPALVAFPNLGHFLVCDSEFLSLDHLVWKVTHRRLESFWRIPGISEFGSKCRVLSRAGSSHPTCSLPSWQVVSHHRMVQCQPQMQICSPRLQIQQGAVFHC